MKKTRVCKEPKQKYLHGKLTAKTSTSYSRGEEIVSTKLNRKAEDVLRRTTHGQKIEHTKKKKKTWVMR